MNLPVSYSDLYPGFFFITADLLCDFEENNCNFEVSTTDTQDTYKWKRKNSDQLNLGEGPLVDHNDSPTGTVYILGQ